MGKASQAQKVLAGLAKNNLVVGHSDQESQLSSHAALFKISKLFEKNMIFFSKCDVLKLRLFFLHGFVLGNLLG